MDDCLQEIQKYLLRILNHLLQVTSEIDILATELSSAKTNNPSATLTDTPFKVHPSQPLREIFLSFCIVELLFFLLMVYTCNFWAVSSTGIVLETVENS